MAKLSAKRRTSQPATKGGARASMNHFLPILGKPMAGWNCFFMDKDNLRFDWGSGLRLLEGNDWKKLAPAKSGTRAEPSMKMATPRLSWSPSRAWEELLLEYNWSTTQKYILTGASRPQCRRKFYEFDMRDSPTLWSSSFQAIPLSSIWGLAVAAQASTVPREKAPRVAEDFWKVWFFTWFVMIWCYIPPNVAISWGTRLLDILSRLMIWNGKFSFTFASSFTEWYHW